MQNFSNLHLVFWQNFQRIMQIPRNSPQKFCKSCKICTIYLSIIHYVSDACPSRALSEIPANQVKFTPFAHKFHELCKFCTKIHPHLVHYFQNHRQRTPGNWSESTRFHAVRPQLLRITRNSLNLQPTVPAI